MEKAYGIALLIGLKVPVLLFISLIFSLILITFFAVCLQVAQSHILNENSCQMRNRMTSQTIRWVELARLPSALPYLLLGILLKRERSFYGPWYGATILFCSRINLDRAVLYNLSDTLMMELETGYTMSWNIPIREQLI